MSDSISMDEMYGNSTPASGSDSISMDEMYGEKPNKGGFLNSVKQTTGQTIKGIGQAAQDFIPGVGATNPITQYGQGVIDANPTAVHGFADFKESPVTGVKEIVGNAASSFGPMLAVRGIGQGITAAAPLAGPYAPVVAGVGQTIAWGGPALMAAFPSYGGIREKQVQNNPVSDTDAWAKTKAAGGALAVGAIETAFGPEAAFLKATTKAGRDALAKKFATKTLGGAIVKGGAVGSGVEGLEEMAQSPIEQLASGDNPLSKESVQDTLYGGFSGAVGGGVLGGVGGGLIHTKPNQPAIDQQSPPVVTDISTGAGMVPPDPAVRDIERAFPKKPPGPIAEALSKVEATLPSQPQGVQNVDNTIIDQPANGRTQSGNVTLGEGSDSGRYEGLATVGGNKEEGSLASTPIAQTIDPITQAFDKAAPIDGGRTAQADPEIAAPSIIAQPNGRGFFSTTDLEKHAAQNNIDLSGYDVGPDTASGNGYIAIKKDAGNAVNERVDSFGRKLWADGSRPEQAPTFREGEARSTFAGSDAQPQAAPVYNDTAARRDFSGKAQPQQADTFNPQEARQTFTGQATPEPAPIYNEQAARRDFAGKDYTSMTLRERIAATRAKTQGSFNQPSQPTENTGAEGMAQVVAPIEPHVDASQSEWDKYNKDFEAYYGKEDLNPRPSTQKSIEQQKEERAVERQQELDAQFKLLPVAVKRHIQSSVDRQGMIDAGTYVDGGLTDKQEGTDATAHKAFMVTASKKQHEAAAKYEQSLRNAQTPPTNTPEASRYGAGEIRPTFIRKPTPLEKKGGALRSRGFNTLPEAPEGFENVYKPYGEQGAGYYVAPVVDKNKVETPSSDKGMAESNRRDSDHVNNPSNEAGGVNPQPAPPTNSELTPNRTLEKPGELIATGQGSSPDHSVDANKKDHTEGTLDMVASGEAKAPWEMTRDEWLSQANNDVDAPLYPVQRMVEQDFDESVARRAIKILGGKKAKPGYAVEELTRLQETMRPDVFEKWASAIHQAFIEQHKTAPNIATEPGQKPASEMTAADHLRAAADKMDASSDASGNGVPSEQTVGHSAPGENSGRTTDDAKAEQLAGLTRELTPQEVERVTDIEDSTNGGIQVGYLDGKRVAFSKRKGMWNMFPKISELVAANDKMEKAATPSNTETVVKDSLTTDDKFLSIGESTRGGVIDKSDLFLEKKNKTEQKEVTRKARFIFRRRMAEKISAFDRTGKGQSLVESWINMGQDDIADRDANREDLTHSELEGRYLADIKEVLKGENIDASAFVDYMGVLSGELNQFLDLASKSGTTLAFQARKMANTIKASLNDTEHLSIGESTTPTTRSELSGITNAYSTRTKSLDGISGVSLTQNSKDGASRSIENLSNMTQGLSFIPILDNIINRDVTLGIGLSASNPVNGQSSTVKGGSKDVIGSSDSLRDIVGSKTFLEKGYSGINIKAQRRVLASVLGASQDSKIVDTVIQLIPVEVVDMLRREKLTPKMLLHNPSMLRLAITKNLIVNVPASIDASSALVKAVALARAIKNAGLSTQEVARSAMNLFAANGTIDSRHVNYNTRQGNIGQVITPEKNSELYGVTNVYQLLTVASKSGNSATDALAKMLRAAIPDEKLLSTPVSFAKVTHSSYSVKNGVTLSEKDVNTLAYNVAVHEAVHAITVKEMANNTSLKMGVRMMMNKVGQKVDKKLLAYAKESEGKSTKFLSVVKGKNLTTEETSIAYALSSPEEFLAQAFSSPSFQELLKSIPATNSTDSYIKNLWDRLITLVGKALEITDRSMLTDVISAVVHIGQSEVTVDYKSGETMPQTETEAFKKWFGKSAVVDKEGKPLVVYHGSEFDFDVFDTREISKLDKKRLGSYFTAQKQLGDLYGKNNYQVYLSMQKPFDITGMSANEAIKEMPIPDQLKMELRSAFRGNDYSQYGLLETAIRGKLRQALEAEGYDGIKYTEGGDAYIIFNPNQAKSAIGNNGDFSESDDINLSIDEAGSIQSVQEVAKGLGKYAAVFSESGKPDTSILSRIFQTPEYYFHKVAALSRMMTSALGRRDKRFEYEHQILGKDFIAFTEGLKKSDKKAYEDANEHLIDTDQTGHAFRVKMVDDSWHVYNTDKEEIGKYDSEQAAVKAMMQAEHDQLIEDGYSANAAKAVHMARQVLNAEFDMRVADMRRISAEARLNGLPDPFIVKDKIDEAGRYGVYNGNKLVALFANEEEANAMLDKAVEAVSYIVTSKDGKVKGFASEMRAKRWAKKNSGQFGTKTTFGKLSVKKRTDKEMRPLTLTQAIAQMGDLRGSYFPRIRPSGEYVLIAKKRGENPKREHFDMPVAGQKWGVKGQIANWTMAHVGRVFPNAAARMMELKAQGYAVEFKKDDSPVDDVFDAAKLIASVDAIIADNLSTINKNDSDEVKAALHVDALLTMETSDIFKGRGALSSRMKRLDGDTVWEGYETDMLKAVVQSARDTAAGMAKRDTAKSMIQAFTGRDFSWQDYKAQKQEEGGKPSFTEYMEIVNDRRVDPGKQKNAYRDGRSFMVDVLRNSEHADRIMGTLQGLAVLKFLGFRVSSAAVNITNMVTGVPGTISGMTGESLSRSFARVGNAANAYSKYRKETRQWHPGETNLSAEDRDIFQAITDNGWDEAQFNHEAAGVLMSKGGEAWSKFTDLSMKMFGAAEKVNRATTIFAAYKAVKAKSPKTSFEAAMDEAHGISNRAHGVYGKETLPMWARGKMNPLRLTYTFQKFGHNYMMNMIDMGFNKKEYKAASYLLLSPAIIGGAGASLAGPALMALAGAFGIGGDDPEEEFYKWAADTFGSDAVARHGLAGLANINIKGSLAVNMPMPSDIGKMTLTDLSGPAGGVVADVAKSMMLFGKGEVAKGAEALLPTAFGSMSKSIRESQEGISTGNYGTVFYGKEPLKADTTDAILRFFSFNPSRISGIREKQWNEKQVAAKYQERRNEIYSEMKRLHMQGKPYLTPETLKEVKRFNDLAKGTGRADIKPITPQRIRLMLRRNDKASKFERRRVLDE